MSLDAGRVCEVHAPGPAPSPGEHQRGEVGSGYLLADGLVLTAYHVIEGAAAPCRVRLGGSDGWVEATEIAWSGDPPIDAALLRVPLALAGEAPRLGRLVGSERVACRALGFPRAQQGEGVRDTEAIAGKIDPLTMRKAGSWPSISKAACRCPTRLDARPGRASRGGPVRRTVAGRGRHRRSGPLRDRPPGGRAGQRAGRRRRLPGRHRRARRGPPARGR
jgi:hypothetical protein